MVVILRTVARRPAASVHHDRADGLALVHEVEALVDVVERQGVGDEVVDVDLALHVPVDDLGHVGATARAAEGGDRKSGVEGNGVSVWLDVGGRRTIKKKKQKQ